MSGSLLKRTRDLEIDLLVCCARTSLDAPHAETLAELVRQNIDWTRVLVLAQRHALLPLVHRHLQPRSDVPQGVRDRLEDGARLNARRNLFLASQLLYVLTVLDRNGIAAMPYKGPVLAARLYGDVACRQFGDLDVFVRPDAVIRARDLLLEAGYDGPLPGGAGRQKLFFRWRNQLELISADHVHVELHWSAAPRMLGIHFDFDGMWRRAERVEMAGMKIPSPAAEELLVLLCIHGAKHEWRRMSWVCDVAQLVASTPRMAWNDVWSGASKASTRRLICLGLLLATDLLGAALPATVGTVIRADAVACALSDRIRERYSSDWGARPELLGRASFNLAVYERRRDKLRYVRRWALTPTDSDWAVVALPRRLTFLYWLVRPARLLTKYGSNALRGPRTTPVS